MSEVSIITPYEYDPLRVYVPGVWIRMLEEYSVRSMDGAVTIAYNASVSPVIDDITSCALVELDRPTVVPE